MNIDYPHVPNITEPINTEYLTMEVIDLTDDNCVDPGIMRRSYWTDFNRIDKSPTSIEIMELSPRQIMNKKEFSIKKPYKFKHDMSLRIANHNKATLPSGQFQIKKEAEVDILDELDRCLRDIPQCENEEAVQHTNKQFNYNYLTQLNNTLITAKEQTLSSDSTSFSEWSNSSSRNKSIGGRRPQHRSFNELSLAYESMSGEDWKYFSNRYKNTIASRKSRLKRKQWEEHGRQELVELQIRYNDLLKQANRLERQCKHLREMLILNGKKSADLTSIQSLLGSEKNVSITRPVTNKPERKY